MDILLTHGYFLYEDAHELQVMKPYPPLGILCLSAYLKHRGFRVGVYDATFGTAAEFGSILESERPPVVGIYCTLMTKFVVLAMVRKAKALGAIVILGGPEPVNYVHEYLARGADVIVAGEGETALEELLPALAASGPHALDKVAGIAFRRDDGSVVRTAPRHLIEDLDTLPDPDREAIAVGKYLDTWKTHHGQGSVSLVCARGCRYHCAWCSHSVYGRTHRRRSPQRVASEVEFILDRYRPEQIWYADDVFTVHHPWLFEYAAELKRRGIRIQFECISRADRLNEDVIATLSEMGCYRLWLGSESGSQRILDGMRRGVKVDHVRAMTHALKRHGIQTGMFVMLGYEGEEVRDLVATLRHVRESAPDVFLTTVAYPIKGTEYYDRIQDRVIQRGSWESRTDRDLGVRGRHSQRFYSFATRWMVNSVALRHGRQSGRSAMSIAKTAANALIGRIGMAITRFETERGGNASGSDDRGGGGS